MKLPLDPKLLKIIRKLRKAKDLSDLDTIINEVFETAPADVKEKVKYMTELILKIKDGENPETVLREVAVKLGLKEDEVDSFIETALLVADIVRENLKGETKT